MGDQQQAISKAEKWEDFGRALVGLCAFATFGVAWWYCAETYGFLFGFGLGWLPAGILASLILAAERLLSPLALGFLGFVALAAVLQLASWVFGF